MSDFHADRIAVREASTDDANALSMIANASFLESFAGIIPGKGLLAHCALKHDPEMWCTLMQQGARIWIAELEGSPVGYAMLAEPDLDAAREGDAELRKIYVLSRFQGQGLAARLLQKVLDAAQGNVRLLLGVKDDNHRAIAFYTKHHFTQVATRQYDIGGVICDDFVLARDLSDASLSENTP